MDQPKTKLLEESPGELSVMRTIMFAVAAAVLGMFIVANLSMLVSHFVKGTALVMVDTPANMMLIFGSVVAGKAIQRFGEK